MRSDKAWQQCLSRKLRSVGRQGEAATNAEKRSGQGNRSLHAVEEPAVRAELELLHDVGQGDEVPDVERHLQGRETREDTHGEAVDREAEELG